MPVLPAFVLPVAALPFQEIYSTYLFLTSVFTLDPKAGLGGKLLYAGEINSRGRNLLFAANIAGTASIAASADPVIQREAIRDGVVDFLVTNLEEALRILKNEIRKHETVSVGVGVAPSQLAAQMIERGVLPDLLAPPAPDLFASEQVQFESFIQQGARQIDLPQALPSGAKYVTWSVDKNFAQWLPKLDQCAKVVIPENDLIRHRWLRLAPRYLGRPAQREHGVALDQHELAEFKAAVETLPALHGAEPELKPTVRIIVAS